MTVVVFSLIAIAFFLTSLVLSLINIFSKYYPAPFSLGLIWGVWGVGFIFMVASWLL